MRNKKVVIVGILAGLVVILVCILALIYESESDSKARSASQADSSTSISIICPSGAPALSLAGVLNSSIDLDYQIVDGGDVLSAAFMSGETDLIIAPINLGINLMQNGADYSLLGVVSWGNLYVVGNRSTYDGSIAAFGQSSVPGQVLEYVQGEFTESITIDWYSSVSEVAQLLLQGEYGAALVSEPILSTILEADESLTILYDIQDLYTDVSGNDTYPQAAIFVNNSSITAKTETIMELCNKIDATISSYNNDASALLTLDIDFSELGFADVELLVEVYEGMALDFVYACDEVDLLSEFLALLDITLTDTMYVR